ncbi:hypothetical protein ACQBAT_13285 [Ornithinimicrobium sp. Y1847]|uniref:hypothetical protein n=1 Tax=Ornithinimicrobium sp. Y1847 TaxID=3405419 RepID=UPI003B6741BC
MSTDSYAELAARFDALTEARAEHQRLTSPRGGLAPQLREAHEEVDRLRAAWDKEARDVRRLEGASPTRAWAAMRGGLQDRLGRERAEEEAAAYGLRRAEEHLAQLEREDASLVASLRRLGDVEEGYEVVLAQVRRRAEEPDAGVLRDRADEAGRQLENIRWRRELDEALEAGHAAHHALEAAWEQLGKAQNWSTYDTFFDGGMLASMMKHDRLDTATELLDRAAEAMQRLSRELADVDLPGLGAPIVDQLSRGLDIWFDNFFTDVMVGQRIKVAREDVGRALAKVEETIATLEGLRAKLG